MGVRVMVRDESMRGWGVRVMVRDESMRGWE